MKMLPLQQHGDPREIGAHRQERCQQDTAESNCTLQKLIHRFTVHE